MHDDPSRSHDGAFPSPSASEDRTGVSIADSADVAADAVIGAGSTVQRDAQIGAGARLGRDCTVGRGAGIGSDVVMGDGCVVQDLALVREPAVLADGVHIGPAAVLADDRFPRAVDPDLSPRTARDRASAGVTCDEGASIGARAVCVAPVRIGAWAMVAAGAVVTEDVPPHALVDGVPARRIAWVGRAGQPLQPAADGSDAWVCPVTGDWYVADEISGGLSRAQDATRATTNPRDEEDEILPAEEDETTPSTTGRAQSAREFVDRLAARASDRHHDRSSSRR